MRCSGNGGKSKKPEAEAPGSKFLQSGVNKISHSLNLTFEHHKQQVNETHSLLVFSLVN